MNLQEIKTAIAEGKKEIVYNDGREGHKNIKATILESDDRKMIVQFEDRADTTTIFFSEKSWMDFITINGMKTLEEIEAIYPHKEWYVGTVEIDSFAKGTTTHYAFAMKKTGEKSKYGGDIYSETERVYFKLVAPFKYKECENPYKH